MSHDPKCRELAKYFLAGEARIADDEKAIEALAEAIQQAIENWLEWKREHL